MANVLVVPASELRHPVCILIGVETDDCLRHACVGKMIHDSRPHSGTIGLVELTSSWIVTPLNAFSVAA